MNKQKLFLIWTISNLQGYQTQAIIQYSSVVRGLPGGHCCCSIPGRHGFNKRQPSHFLGRVSDGTPGHPPPTSAGQSLPPHVGRDSQNVENSPTNVIWKFFLQAKITFYKGLFISQRMRYWALCWSHVRLSRQCDGMAEASYTTPLETYCVLRVTSFCLIKFWKISSVVF